MVQTSAIPAHSTQTSSTQNPTSQRENRQHVILDAAASLFRRKGYEATSVRDIATASNMLPGSIYFHFPSKEEIFLAVQIRGIQHLSDAVQTAVIGIHLPWARLEAACAAHMNSVLHESDYAASVVNAMPMRDLAVWEQLAALRESYERNFRQLVDDLPLPAGTNRKYLRLSLLGSMNWAYGWYRPGGDTPEQLAAEIVWLYRCGLEPEY